METIKTLGGDEVSFSLERGGIITSIKLKGREILYLDGATFENTKANVRGGVPILFPNSGAIKSVKFPNLKQHGFARTSSEWLLEKKDANSFTEVLMADDATRKIFPYDFELSLSGKFEKNDSITLTQSVKNLEKGKAMPISMGLHPYFNVPDNKKRDIKFNFGGKNLTDEQFDSWMNGTAVSVDNPKAKDINAISEVFIPSLGVLAINASREYKKIKIWSVPKKDFICIEPVMRDDGGLIDDPQILRPQETFSASVNLEMRAFD